MQISQISDDTKANHTLYAYPYMIDVNYTYTSYYPSTRNLVDNPSGNIITPAINVAVSLYSSKDTYLAKDFMQVSNTSSSDHILPIATRYADVKAGVYVIERPPFQIPIDYYTSKQIPPKMPTYLQGKTMWIPWTVFVVSLNKNVNHLTAKMYFNDKPLSSLEDDVIVRAFTPNIFDDARICFGNSAWTFGQRVESGEIEYNVSNVYNYLFNDYFTQWNPDIHTKTINYIYEWMTKNKVFDSIHASKQKNKPKGFDDLANWQKYKTAWPYCLYAMSQLSFEQNMQFISDYRNCFPYKSETTTRYSISTTLKDVLNQTYDPNWTETTLSQPEVDYSIVDIHGWDRFFKSSFDISPQLKVNYSVVVKDAPTMPSAPQTNSETFANIFNTTKIIEVVYTHFFNNIEKALQIVKDKYGVTSNTFNLDTIMGFSNAPIMGFSNAHDHAAYKQALVREVNDLANLTLIQFSYEDLVKDVHV